jgi:hypothetical protein
VQNGRDRQADEKSEDYIPINIWRKGSSASENDLYRQAKEIIFLPAYPVRIFSELYNSVMVFRQK